MTQHFRVAVQTHSDESPRAEERQSCLGFLRLSSCTLLPRAGVTHIRIYLPREELAEPIDINLKDPSDVRADTFEYKVMDACGTVKS